MTSCIISDDFSHVQRVLVARGAGGQPPCTQPVVAGFGIGLDDDISPLPGGSRNAVGRVWNDGHEIIHDDCQGVVVYGRPEVVFDGGIEETACGTSCQAQI